jgi:hypothetical protein
MVWQFDDVSEEVGPEKIDPEKGGGNRNLFRIYQMPFCIVGERGECALMSIHIST